MKSDIEDLAKEAKQKINIAEQYITKVSKVPNEEQKLFIHNQIVKAKNDIDSLAKSKQNNSKKNQILNSDGSFNIIIEEGRKNLSSEIQSIIDNVIKSTDRVSFKGEPEYNIEYVENPINYDLRKEISQLVSEINKLSTTVNTLRVVIKQKAADINHIRDTLRDEIAEKKRLESENNDLNAEITRIQYMNNYAKNLIHELNINMIYIS